MAPDSSACLAKSVAVTRIAAGVFFLFFGEYKVIPGANGFSNGVVQGYLSDFVQQGYAVGFYRSFLATVVLPHANFFTFVVGIVELAVGLSLVLGLFVRAGCILGALHMINLTLATWHEAGPGAATWRWFGVQLDHIPMLLLFVIFFAASAGHTWGLDGLFSRSTRTAAAPSGTAASAPATAPESKG